MNYRIFPTTLLSRIPTKKLAMVCACAVFFIAPHAFAATFVNDSFTDATNTLLENHTGEVGATWTKNSQLSSGSIVLLGDGLASNNTTGFSLYYPSGRSADADYSVSANMLFYSNVGSFGILARASTSSLTYYNCDYEGGNQLNLYTAVNGSLAAPTISTPWTPVASTTYTIKLSAIGNVITCYVNGVQMLQETDSHITAAGVPSIFFSYIPSSYTTGMFADSFSAMDETAPSQATAFSITGPSSGFVNASSTNFTVTPNATYNGTITITPSGGGLSSSSPIVLTFASSSAPQTFTILPTATGSVTLTPSNSGSLTNPSTLTYNSIPPSFVYDSFTDAAGTALENHTGEIGATWTKNSSFASGGVVISSANRARSNSNYFSIYYPSGVATSSDYTVSADDYFFSNPGTFGIGGRASTSTLTYYLFDYEGNNEVNLYAVVNGSNVETTLSAPWAPTPNTQYHFALSMDGSLITAYINGSVVLQETDSNITAPGSPMLFFSYGDTDSSGSHVDNFTASYIPAATSYTFTGPSSGPKNVTSSNFTVTPNGTYHGTITITPSGAGLSTPIVLNFASSSAPQTFTITPPIAGTVTLTPSNSGGLADASPLTYVSENIVDSGVIPVTSSELWDNGYTNANDPRQSDAAFLRVVTDAGILKITGDTNLNTLLSGYSSLGLKINGVLQTPLLMNSNGTTTFTVNLPAGTNTIDITDGPQALSGTSILGTYIDSVEFQGYTNYQIVTPPVTPVNRIVIYGDSITSGFMDSVNDGTRGWTGILRDAGENVMLEAYASRGLFDDASTTPGLQALVSRIASYDPTQIWTPIGSNDYGLNLWSAASFGAAYALLMNELHIALPNAKIFCQTPIVRISEVPNQFGNTLNDYRAQIANVCNSSRPWTQFVDGTAILSLADLSGDGLHPTSAGHLKYENYVAPLVAQGGGFTPSLVQSGPTASISLTRALGSTYNASDTIAVAWGDGASTQATFAVGSTTAYATHTYAATGQYAISFSNGQSWPNPPSLSYVVTSTNTGGETSGGDGGGGGSIEVSTVSTSTSTTTATSAVGTSALSIISSLQAKLSTLLAELSALGVTLPASLVSAANSSSAHTSSSASTETYTFTRNLTVGSVGADVRALQTLLNTNGFMVAASGPGSINDESTYFGQATKAALARLQRAYNITPALGFFGPTTREIVFEKGL